MASLPEGTLVLDGRFKILSSLGRGGMGEVYLGEQVSLARKVALKVLKRDVTAQPAALERFKREALLLSTVDHPSVVRVIDYGSDAGAAWLVMDLVEGRNLREVLDADGPFAPERALRLLQQLAEGLAAIHEKGIVHRDLKPENVVLAQSSRGEQAKLLDFGIARLIEPEASTPSVTQDGLVLGTPEYVSPEQAMGQDLDSRSDVYSFGVLAFRMLAGSLPFDGPAPRQFMAQHAAAPPKRIDEVNPALLAHPGLSALVMRCLEKDARSRPQRADELTTVLESMRMVFSGTHPAVSGAQPLVTPPGTQPMGAVRPEPTAAATFSPPPSKTTGNTLSGKTQNLTLMLTDIKGFTARTSEQTREENARMLKDHDTLLLPITESYGGKLRQKRGDALLLTFTSPTEAVLCGMGIQDALFRFNETVPAERKLNVRVCIHAGEVLVHEDAVFGEPLKVVEKVEGEADGGEVCFTEAVRLQMNRAEVPHEPRGELSFGGTRFVLYKATPAPNGLPFGGRDAKERSLSSSLPSKTQMHRALSRFSAMKPRTKTILGAVALLVLVGIVASLIGGDSTAALARNAIVEGRPKEALNIITLAEREKKKLSPVLRQLRAVALHRIGEHEDEIDALYGVGKSNLERVEPLVFSVLAMHHAKGRTQRLREVMGWIAPQKLQAAFTDLVDGAPNDEQWGALRYLDLESKTLEGKARVKGYVRALENPECGVRELAISRLEKLGDPAAADALEKIKPPAEGEGVVGGVLGFFAGDDCGVSRGKKVAAALRKK